MRKHQWMLAAMTLLITLAAPGKVADQTQGDGQPTGKHNFDQWQTIKRLEIRN
ncbi:hypothetical protein OS242_17640 [Tumebacillus sp. DT12]|uniref:Uncharacterized protein n=1 Tax=Tumebacillus lacus TaxID=2995335 RepID=A0ABT3X4F8_9BACL|nr:hypothetical protein [Tumebacillus lacus]MCX7571770.1 hypothetical protein [Tumebacillus lacus]